MAKVPAKCTQCGANIEIDDGADAGVCPYCGTAFVTQKAINNYNTYVTAHITVDGKNADEAFGLAQAAKLSEAKEKCRKLLAADMLQECLDTATELTADRPESPVGYAYAVMAFAEYRAFGTDRYEEMLNNRCVTALHFHPFAKEFTLPMHRFYEPLARLVKGNAEYEAEYGEVLRRAEKIMADYDETVARKLSAVSAPWIVLTVISIGIAIASIVMMCIISPFFVATLIFCGIMGIAFLYIAVTRLLQAKRASEIVARRRNAGDRE